jgi:hypothetical protein
MDTAIRKIAATWMARLRRHRTKERQFSELPVHEKTMRSADAPLHWLSMGTTFRRIAATCMARLQRHRTKERQFSELPAHEKTLG